MKIYKIWEVITMLLYEGKAKQIFKTDDDHKVIIHYKDDATAFNGVKKSSIANKGILNNAITTIIFEMLEKRGVKTHFIEKLNDRDQLCHAPDVKRRRNDGDRKEQR